MEWAWMAETEAGEWVGPFASKAEAAKHGKPKRVRR